MPFTVPAKNCDVNHYITFRTSAPDSSLPPEGTRITPCYAGVVSLPGRPSYSCPAPANVMARVQTTTSASALTFALGANYYRFIGLELTRPTGTGKVHVLVSSSGASHVIFDRMWVHGTAADTTITGVSLDGSTYGAILDSYLNDFHCPAPSAAKCTGSVAIAAGNSGPQGGAWKMVNNFIEGGESIGC